MEYKSINHNIGEPPNTIGHIGILKKRCATVAGGIRIYSATTATSTDALNSHIADCTRYTQKPNRRVAVLGKQGEKVEKGEIVAFVEGTAEDAD